MYAGLTSAYDNMGIGTLSAQRDHILFADFLEEASILLNKPALHATAPAFRNCAQAWGELGLALLPDAVPLFKETRELMQRQRQVFIEKGLLALPECQQIKTRLGEIRAAVSQSFPLSEAQATALLQNITADVLQLGVLEEVAFEALRASAN